MTFEEWLSELEGCSLIATRAERAYDDLVVNPPDEVDNWKTIKQWLKGAFDAGYEAGQFNKQYLINDLRNELRILQQEKHDSTTN